MMMRSTTALPGAAPTMLTCRLRSCRLALAVQAPCCQRLGARSRRFCAPLRLHAYSTRAQLAEATNDDAHVEATRVTLGAVQSQEAFCYGEGINMLQHALQAAQAAREQGETADAVLAALLHDVGNSPQARAAWVSAGHPDPPLLTSPADDSIGYAMHAEVGAQFLRGVGFSELVCGAVKLHVEAKRALVAMDPGYMQELTQASIDTLAQQGGPLSAVELEDFLGTPGAEVALRLRRYDDQGKVPQKEVPQLPAYRGEILNHLIAQSSAQT